MKIKSRSLSNSQNQDPSHMQVQVQDKITHFLENRKEVLSDGDVRKIVGKLQGHVTD